MTSSRPSTRGWQSLTAGFPPRGRARRETSVSTIDHGPDSPPNQHGSNPRAFAVAARGHSRRPFDDAAVLSGPDGQSAGPRALRGSPARHRRPCSRTLVSRVGHAKRRRSPEYVRSLVPRQATFARVTMRPGADPELMHRVARLRCTCTSTAPTPGTWPRRCGVSTASTSRRRTYARRPGPQGGASGPVAPLPGGDHDRQRFLGPAHTTDGSWQAARNGTAPSPMVQPHRVGGGFKAARQMWYNAAGPLGLSPQRRGTT